MNEVGAFFEVDGSTGLKCEEDAAETVCSVGSGIEAEGGKAVGACDELGKEEFKKAGDLFGDRAFPFASERG